MTPFSPIRVLLVDDHALFRKGIASLLAAEPGFEVVGEAEDGLRAVERARELMPDGGADVRLVLEYQRGTLDAALADRLLADLDERLAAATAEPGTPFSRLPLSQQPALPAGAKTSGLTGRSARVALPPGPVREDPGSPLAHEIPEIWRKLLGNTQLGLGDNFFDAGGDSLHAVQMLAHLEPVRGECVSAGMLMQAVTARLLAAALEKSFASQGAYPRGIVLVQRGDSSRYLFCLPGLGGVAVSRCLSTRQSKRRETLALKMKAADDRPRRRGTS